MNSEFQLIFFKQIIFGFISLSLFSFKAIAQNKEALKVYEGIDDRYREDQIYVSATFNVLNHLPSGVTQSGFSGGFHTGFIRDFPVNRRRNLAIGLGVGYSFNVYNHNLVASPNATTGEANYAVPSELSIKNNRFHTQLLELPLQIRWRTSTAENYKFWRIYGGLRGGYITRFKTEFEANSGEKFEFANPSDINRWRLGATLSVGWNTWNFHVYYSLTDFFKNGVISDNNQKNMSTIKLGLEFFIL